jgi:6-phosphogluconolactonase (cycloisomerase 2 family)
MSIVFRPSLTRVATSLCIVCLASAIAAAAGKPHYVVTNDDQLAPFATGVTLYTVKPDGVLTMKGKVATGTDGIGGGYFGANRVTVLDSANAQCIYASQAASGEIVGISVTTRKKAGHAHGSKKDTGASNGIGLAMNSQYLYASFTDYSVIGTFQVLPGCKIKFLSNLSVLGRQNGTIDGMVIHGNMMVVTYGDGSIESFNISAGPPVSNGDKQNSTGSHGGNTYPNGIDITEDGHYALFGDTATSTIVEVSDISSGKLTPTVVYRLGDGISSSNILLSPDETLLYISNTQGDTVTAAFFDASTGQLSKGCVSNALKGYVTDWSYLGSLALGKTTGTGGTVYVAEFGAPSSIAEISVSSSAGECTFEEMSQSPASDPNSSPGLLSIGSFPPRPF